MPYSALDYSDDYILDVTESEKTGKRYLFVGERKEVELPIRVTGSNYISVTKVPISIESSSLLRTNSKAKYKGKVTVSSSTSSTGSASKRIETNHKTLGKLLHNVSEGVKVEGKKDYTKVKSMLNKLMEDL